MIEHKNRVPGAGKANRKLITPEGGAAPFNAVVTFDDSPVDAGAPVTKLVLDEFLAASGTTTGTSTALVLAQAGFVLADGAPVRFKLHTAIAGAVTLAVGGTAAKPLTYLAGNAVISNTPAGTWLTAVYSTTLGTYAIQADVSVMNVSVTSSVENKVGATALSVARAQLSAVTNGLGHVLFGGGSNAGSTYYNTVNKYLNATSVMSTLTGLANQAMGRAAATFGDGGVLFVGGYYGSSPLTDTDKYDTADVHTNITALSVGRKEPAAAADGAGNIIVAGGVLSSFYPTTTVERFTSAGVRTILDPLGVNRTDMAAVTDNNGNVILAGGSYPGTTYYANVDKYDTAGVRTALSPLSVARSLLAGAKDGAGNILFGGGNASGVSSDVVDKYDTAGVRTTITSLTVGRPNLCACKDRAGNVLFFGAGTQNVEKYDTAGVRTAATAMAAIKYYMAAAADGDGCILVGGGTISGTVSATVEKYVPKNYYKNITVPLYASYRFQEHATEQRAMSDPTTVSVMTPNTGTIRFGGALTI